MPMRFVVAVFLADISIGVWEFKNRNSGHTEAGTLALCKYCAPADLFVYLPHMICADVSVVGAGEVCQ